MALSDIAEQLEKSDPSLARYNRQMLWEPIGIAGQKKLKASRVLMVGCGALGTVLANTLARAGVGHLTIIDRDFIEINNLQRQVLFDQQDIADQLPKAVAAKKKIAQINSDVQVEAVVADVNHTNILNLQFAPHDTLHEQVPRTEPHGRSSAERREASHQETAFPNLPACTI